MHKFPSIFLVARDLRDSTQLYAGYNGITPAWSEPTNGDNPIVYDSRESAEDEASDHLGAYVVEFIHKP